MNQFVESLYRLYRANKISKQQLELLLVKNKITQQDYNYIVAVENE